MDYFCSPGRLCVPVGHGYVVWIFFAILLAYATAISYSELAKLYPGRVAPISSRKRPSSTIHEFQVRANR